MDLDALLSDLFEDIQHNRISLPTLPEVALKVRSTLEDPDTTSSKLAEMISKDMALSSKMIQVANGPVYRTRTPITKVQNAVTRLGGRLVRNLVTMLVMEQLYQAGANSNIRDMIRKAWLHSTHVAALSRVIARHFSTLNPDEAMLAGLTHDLGTLPLICRAETYPQLMKDAQLWETVNHELHTKVGKAVMEAWKFPDEFIAVVAEHEDLGRSHDGPVDYVDVVIVANLHSHLGEAGHRYSAQDWSDVPAFEKLGLTPDESINAMEAAKDEIRETQKMFVIEKNPEQGDASQQSAVG